jgi:hypothetical protein
MHRIRLAPAIFPDSRSERKWTFLLAWIGLICLPIGCVQDHYQYGISRQELTPRLPRTPNLITVGGNHPRIDSIERVVKYPGKKFAEWFPSNDPFHSLPVEARQLKVVQTASDYLDSNGLKGVYLDVREYNPREQWNRLLNNDRVSPFWKYTGGTLYHIGYCVLPGRAFGLDSYNGFTNTLSVNSLSPPRALFHAGYVKKLYDQRYPGSYMAMNWLPVMPLIRDTSVSSDVLTYSRAIQDSNLENQLYPQVYGRLGGDAVSQATSLIPGMAYMPFYMSPILTGTGRIAGRITGRAIADNRTKYVARNENASTNAQ